MPVAAETVQDAAVPTIPSKKVEAGSKRRHSRSRSTSRSRSRSHSTSRSHSSRSHSTSRRPKLNASHNLSLSDLFTRNFAPDKAEEDDQVEVQYYFWGAELSCSAPTHSWKLFQEEEECEDDMRHLLFLRQATLGVNAIEGERNIVQVTSKDFEGKVVKHVLCSLTLGQGLDTTDLDLTLQYDHEVSFKLIKGSGPVHLVGNHYVETPPADEEVVELDETDASEVEDLDDMKDEDEKDLKEGADEEYETEEDDKTKGAAEKKGEEVEAMEN